MGGGGGEGDGRAVSTDDREETVIVGFPALAIQIDPHGAAGLTVTNEGIGAGVVVARHQVSGVTLEDDAAAIAGQTDRVTVAVGGLAVAAQTDQLRGGVIGVAEVPYEDIPFAVAVIRHQVAGNGDEGNHQRQ